MTDPAGVMAGMKNLVPPAARPFSALADQVQDWTYRAPFTTVWANTDRGGILALHKDRLGRQTRCVTHAGHRWWVWEDPDYTIYVHPSGVLEIDVPEGVPPEQCSKSYLWDLGLLRKVLTRKEHQHWLEEGKRLGESCVLNFPDQDQETLKRFVLDYCDGRILCDHQVRDKNLLGMVFMPLVLGAWAPTPPDEKEGTDGCPAWKAMQILPPEAGDEPKRAPPPPKPEKPPYPPPPAEPAWVQPDSTTVDELQFDIRWEARTPEALTEYHESIRLRNEGLERDHQQRLAEWEEAKAQIDAAHQASLDAHRAAVAAWELETAEFHDRHRTWERQKAIRAAAQEGLQMVRFQRLGTIYEDLSKAGPRSINGYPIFTSFRVLNREDWTRARAAIIRELERRESMEI